MNCFEIAKKVLDRNFGKIEGDHEGKIRLINQRIHDLQAAYGNLDQQGGIDYSDPITQFAYIYKYTTAHASYVCKLLEKADRKEALPTEGMIRLASIGGGPGSDFLGFLKFYNSINCKKFSAISNSFDKDSGWSYCWSRVYDEVFECSNSDDFCCRLSANFHHLDVCDPMAHQRIEDFIDSDIVTMTYFMSEVFQYKEKATPFFSYLFANIKSGATILFIDNKTERYQDWFDSFVTDREYDVLVRGDDRWFPPFDEEKVVLGEYLDYFNHKPKLNGEVAYRVVRKK